MIDRVPMAVGSPSPIWPLPNVTRKRYTFGANRAGGTRHHAGVDMYAPPGSEVLAPESGQLIRSHRFLGPKAVALLMQTDSGPVINFGEVFPDSWKDFGLKIGDRVEAGQPVARVGITPGGSSMLHFEMYTRGTRSTKRWYQGEPPPRQLLNPTRYMKSASALDSDQQDIPGEDSSQTDKTPQDDHVEDEDATNEQDSEDPGADKVGEDPDASSTIPDSTETPGTTRAGGGLVAAAIGLGILALIGSGGHR